MKDDSKIDEFFRHRLRDAEVDSDPGIWERIEARIEDDSTRKRVIGWRWAAVAAILILAIGGVTSLLVKIDDLDTQVSELHDQLERKDRGSADAEEKNEAGRESVQNGLSSNENEKGSEESDTTVHRLVVRMEDPESENSSDEEFDRSSAENESSEKDRIGVSMVYDVTTILEENRTEYSSMENMNSATAIQILSDAMPLELLLTDTLNSELTDANLAENEMRFVPPVLADFFKEEDRYQELAWAVEGMANSTFRQVNGESTSSALAFSNANETAGTTFGVLLKVNKEILSGLRANAGIEYSKWEQSGTYDFEISEEQGVWTAASAIDEFDWNLDTTFFTSLAVNNVQVHFESTTEGVGISELDTIDLSMTKTEVIDWMSVPIGLEYDLWKGKKVSLILGGGGSFDRSISTKSSLTASEGVTVTDAGRSQLEKRNHLGLYGQIGVEYVVSESMSVRFSPRYKIWASRVFEGPDFSTKLNSTSLMIGVRYRPVLWEGERKAPRITLP